jgi:uncharacterized protein
VLLYAGDILAAYGLLALLLVGALRWPDRRLWVVAALFAVAGTLVYGWVQVDAVAAGPEVLPGDPVSGALVRGFSFLFLAPMIAVMVGAPVLVGIWAARRRILDEPARHLRLLRRLAVAGLAIAAVGALPTTLQAVGLWTPGSPAAALAAACLHTLTGYPGGLAYAAIVALVVVRLRDRRGPVVTALAACGQRSMTFYLAQSVVWLVTTEPYLLDFGGRLGVATAAAVGAGTWVASVLAAAAMARAGRRGPAETALRHLTYRSPLP